MYKLILLLGKDSRLLRWQIITCQTDPKAVLFVRVYIRGKLSW